MKVNMYLNILHHKCEVLEIHQVLETSQAESPDQLACGVSGDHIKPGNRTSWSGTQRMASAGHTADENAEGFTRTLPPHTQERANSYCPLLKSAKMFLTRSEYDRGVNTFSPEGRLFQVEYAIEAIKLGSTAIGIQTLEGVCLAVEKRITSPLMEPSSIEKIVEIDTHIGCAMSGLIADAKTLIDKARVETQNHWFTYNETMTVESVTQAVSNLALQFGEEDADPGAMSRPFGVALLFGGLDEKGPQLYHMDPSGTFVQCDARAIGSASEGAQSSLQEVYHKSMTLKEAIKSSLTILKQVMEEKLNATNIELATIEPGKAFHMYSKEELEEVIKDI
ncbi:proteasome subunit alpha type-5 [Arapaima gigas]